MIDLYEKLAIPDSCYLGKRIFKKLFYENTQLNSTDKKAFSNDIENIEWKYTLKSDTINISRYRDEEREYDEIAVIQVTLEEPGRSRRIARIIQKAIPYPLLIIFQHDSTVALNVAAKRINRADREKITVEELQDSPWINLESPSDQEKEFLDSLSISNYSYNDFYEFYTDLTDRITALNCAVHTGQYCLHSEDSGKTETGEVGASYSDKGVRRRYLLLELEGVQQEKTELRNKLKKEKNMGLQVQLNTRVKKLTDRIEAIRSEL